MRESAVCDSVIMLVCLSVYLSVCKIQEDILLIYVTRCVHVIRSVVRL